MAKPDKFFVGDAEEPLTAGDLEIKVKGRVFPERSFLLFSKGIWANSRLVRDSVRGLVMVWEHAFTGVGLP